MKKLMESWRGLINDDESEERVCLDRSAFDLLMKRVADEYDDHLKNVMIEDEQRQKIDKLCNQYGYREFSDFLRSVNLYNLAQNGNLMKPQK